MMYDSGAVWLSYHGDRINGGFKSKKHKKEDDQVILFIICSAFFLVILLVLQRESRQEPPRWRALSLWRQELQPKEGWE